MLSGVYTWEPQCLKFPDPCTQTGNQCSAEPQCWFWLLAAATGLALIVQRRRK